MLNTIQKPSVISPFQVKQNKPFERKDPFRIEVEKNLGKIILEITVEEDIDTLNSLSGLPGPIIAYKATVRKDSQVLGIGRGTAILTKVRKWLESSSRYSLNSAILDGVANSLKSLDALCLQGNSENQIEEIEPASDKQKSYLRTLISMNITNEAERSRWGSQIETMTKDEASGKIQFFMNK